MADVTQAITLAVIAGVLGLTVLWLARVMPGWTAGFAMRVLGVIALVLCALFAVAAVTS